MHRIVAEKPYYGPRRPSFSRLKLSRPALESPSDSKESRIIRFLVDCISDLASPKAALGNVADQTRFNAFCAAIKQTVGHLHGKPVVLPRLTSSSFQVKNGMPLLSKLNS